MSEFAKVLLNLIDFWERLPVITWLPWRHISSVKPRLSSILSWALSSEAREKIHRLECRVSHTTQREKYHCSKLYNSQNIFKYATELILSCDYLEILIVNINILRYCCLVGLHSLRAVLTYTRYLLSEPVLLRTPLKSQDLGTNSPYATLENSMECFVLDLFTTKSN